jgi:hypothetical protein
LHIDAPGTYIDLWTRNKLFGARKPKVDGTQQVSTFHSGCPSLFACQSLANRLPIIRMCINFFAQQKEKEKEIL